MCRCAGPVKGGREAGRLTSAVNSIHADIAGLQLLVAALCGSGGGAEGERSAWTHRRWEGPVRATRGLSEPSYHSAPPSTSKATLRLLLASPRAEDWRKTVLRTSPALWPSFPTELVTSLRTIASELDMKEIMQCSSSSRSDQSNMHDTGLHARDKGSEPLWRQGFDHIDWWSV